MSETVLFGKVKDHELMVLKFSGELKKKQDGWKKRRTNRGLPEVLGLEPPGEISQRSLEDTDLDGSL